MYAKKNKSMKRQP